MEFDIQENWLALDFDGVIADSIEECLVVGYNGFHKYLGEEKRAFSLSDLNSERVAESRRLRNYIRSGEDYVYINLAIHEKTLINNQEDFDDFTEEKKHLQKIFLDHFYDEREFLMAHHRPLWIKLNPLFQNMNEFLKQFPHKKRLLIISTKRPSYIIEILSSNGVEFNPEHIFHATKKRNKRTIIQNVLEKHDIYPIHFHFVDDQVDTLLKGMNLGIQCYLAKWGYNNDEQIRKARKANIHVLTLEEFVHAIH